MTTGTLCEITSSKGAVCRDILDDLSEWFGIPAAVEAYVLAVEDLPMFAVVAQGSPVGFVSIKLHNAFSAEAYVLGVKRTWHRRGIGRRLLQHVEDLLRPKGFINLSVKTVAAVRPNAAYAVTRHFYEALEFLPVEVFPTLWGPDNPCLLMIKCIGHASLRVRASG